MLHRNFGQLRPTSDKFGAEFGFGWAIPTRIWGKVGRHRSNVTQPSTYQNSLEIRIRANLGKHWPEVDQIWSTLDDGTMMTVAFV